jgi:hypothetical protein
MPVWSLPPPNVKNMFPKQIVFPNPTDYEYIQATVLADDYHFD